MSRLCQLKLNRGVDECRRIGPSCMKMNGHIESTDVQHFVQEDEP